MFLSRDYNSLYIFWIY